jgi:hypothetical protein
MAVVEYGVPECSMEPFTKKPKRNGRHAHREPTWWVREMRKMSLRAAMKKPGDRWWALPVVNPDAPDSQQKVYYGVRRFGGGIELGCTNTGCSHMRGIRVARLIEKAKKAVAAGEDWIWV